MQHLIELLATKTVNAELSNFSVGGKPKGLSKITELAHLSRIHTSFLFAIFLNEHISKITLKAHLVARYKQGNKDDEKLLKIVCGAITALQKNEYRFVICYKCGGAGCDKCDQTGKRRRKVKEYELCNMPKSTWYSKTNASVREIFNEMVDYLLFLQAEIELITAQNKTN